MVHGNNILILKDGTAIAGTRSHSIQADGETIEISSPNSAQWKEFIAGRKEWSVTVNYLVVAAGNVRDVLQVGGSYTLLIRDRDNTSSVTGTALCKTAKQTATWGNIAQGSFTFKGTGALT